MIPIQNIYYLLCYAWDQLDMKDWVAVEGKDTTELPNLLTRVFVQGMNRLIKKGLVHSYVPITGRVSRSQRQNPPASQPGTATASAKPDGMPV